MQYLMLFVLVLVLLVPEVHAKEPLANIERFTLEEREELNRLKLEVTQGVYKAAFQLAERFEKAEYYRQAEHWYRYAFAKNFGQAGFALYRLHKQRHIKLKQPEIIKRLGVQMMSQEAKKGDASSALALALIYLKGEYIHANYDQATELLYFARSRGRAIASYHLGNVYMNGLFKPIQYHKAMRYYTEAAEGGVAEAIRQLAIAHLTGNGKPYNLNKAIAYLEESAAQSNAHAMRDLANIYRYERPNRRKYLRWMTQAAEYGDSDAMYYLGEYYEKRNPARAQEFFLRAAEDKHRMAQNKIARITHAVPTMHD